MKKSFTLFFAFVCPVFLFSQSAFHKTYTFGAFSQWADHVIQTSDGGFIIPTSDWSSSYGLIKTDVNGTVQWAKQYVIPVSSYFYPYGVVTAHELSGGGYLLASSGYDTTWTTGLYFIIKTDAGGNLIWSNFYSLSNWYGLLSSYHIIETGQGYTFLGQITDYATSASWFHLFQVSASGGLLWSKVYARNSKSEVYDLGSTQDGGLVMVGEMVDSLSWSENLAVIKTDAGGILQWAKIYDVASAGFLGGVLYSVKGTPDNGMIVAGADAFFNNNSHLISLDANGNVLWAKVYSVPGGHNIDVNGTGDFFIKGVDMITNKCTMTKTDNSGNAAWSRIYDAAPGFNYYSGFSLNSDGGVSIAGTSGSFALLRTDSMGDPGCSSTLIPDSVYSFIPTFFINNCVSQLGLNASPVLLTTQSVTAFETIVCQTLGIEEEEQNGFSIFPNPSEGIIQISNSKSQNANVEIYNTLGEKIYSASVTGRQPSVNLSAQPKGIYFLEILSDGESTVRKIVIQ